MSRNKQLYIVPRRTRSNWSIPTLKGVTEAEQYELVETAARAQAFHEFRRDYTQEGAVQQEDVESLSDSELEVASRHHRIYPDLSAAEFDSDPVLFSPEVQLHKWHSDTELGTTSTPRTGVVPDLFSPSFSLHNLDDRSQDDRTFAPLEPAADTQEKTRLQTLQPNSAKVTFGDDAQQKEPDTMVSSSTDTASETALQERALDDALHLELELPQGSALHYEVQKTTTEVNELTNLLYTVQELLSGKQPLPKEITVEKLAHLYSAYQYGDLPVQEGDIIDFKVLYDAIVVETIEKPDQTLNETIKALCDKYHEDISEGPDDLNETVYSDAIDFHDRDSQTQVTFGDLDNLHSPEFETFPEEDPLANVPAVCGQGRELLNLVAEVRQEFLALQSAITNCSHLLADAASRVQGSSSEDPPLQPEKLEELLQDITDRYASLYDTANRTYDNPALHKALHNLNPQQAYPQEATVGVVQLRPRPARRGVVNPANLAVPNPVQAQVNNPGQARQNPPAGGGQGPRLRRGPRGQRRIPPVIPAGQAQVQVPGAQAAAQGQVGQNPNPQNPNPQGQGNQAQVQAQAQAQGQGQAGAAAAQNAQNVAGQLGLPPMAQGRLIGVLQGLQNVLQQQQQNPNVGGNRESISLLPKDAFSGIDPTKAKIHMNAFKRYVEYHRARGMLQTWADIRRMFAVTLAPPASEWFAALPIVGANAVNTIDTLEVAFLRKYNVWGTTERQWEEAWDALRYNPAKDDYSVTIADVKSLGSLLKKTDDQKRSKCVRILPPFIQALVTKAKTIDELATAVDEMLPIFHQQVKDQAKEYGNLGQVLTHYITPQGALVPAMHTPQQPPNLPQIMGTVQVPANAGLIPLTTTAPPPQVSTSQYYTGDELNAAQSTLEMPTICPQPQLLSHFQTQTANPGDKVQYVAPNGKQIGTYEVPQEGEQGKTYFRRGNRGGRGGGRGGGPQNQGRGGMQGTNMNQNQSRGFKPTQLNVCKMCITRKHDPAECPETKANMAYLAALTGTGANTQAENPPF